VKTTRITTGRGSHIVPPLDQDWSALLKLEWHASIASMDTGLEIRVSQTDKSFPSTYMVTIVGASAHSDCPFDAAWTLINGIASGGRAVRDTT